MVLLVAVVAVCASVPLTGGRLSALAGLRLQATWALLLAAALQLAVAVAPLDDVLLRSGHLLSYAFAAVAVVANRRIPGLLLIAAGGAANLAAISANGGVMPAAPAALRRAGLAAVPHGFSNSTAVDAPRLAPLGDVFAIPAGWPLANVFSIGDVLLVVGVAVLVHSLCRRSRPRGVGRTIAVVAPAGALRQGGRPPRPQEPVGGPAHLQGLDGPRPGRGQGGARPR